MLAARVVGRILRSSCRPMSVLAIDDNLNGLTEDQKELRETVKNFAQAELAPHADAIDKQNDFPQLREFWKKCGDMGFHGVTCPEEYGGLLKTYFYSSIVFARGPTVKNTVCIPVPSLLQSSFSLQTK